MGESHLDSLFPTPALDILFSLFQIIRNIKHTAVNRQGVHPSNVPRALAVSCRASDARNIPAMPIDSAEPS
jgi:hypothetical protein